MKKVISVILVAALLLMMIQSGFAIPVSLSYPPLTTMDECNDTTKALSISENVYSNSGDFVQNTSDINGWVVYKVITDSSISFAVTDSDNIQRDWIVEKSINGDDWVNVDSTRVITEIISSYWVNTTYTVMNINSNYVRIRFPVGVNSWKARIQWVEITPGESIITLNDASPNFSGTDDASNLTKVYYATTSITVDPGNLFYQNDAIPYYENGARSSGFIAYKVSQGSDISFVTRLADKGVGIGDFTLQSTSDGRNWENIGITSVTDPVYYQNYWAIRTYSASNINAKYIRVKFPTGIFSWKAKIDSVTITSALTQTVSIDPNNIVNDDYEGQGLQWDPNEWFDMSNDRWNQITDWIGFAKIGTIRCMSQCYFYTTGFDSGEPVFIWSDLDVNGNYKINLQGKPVDFFGNDITENVKRMNKIYKILDFCQANNVDVIIGEWGYPAVPGIYEPGAYYLNYIDYPIYYQDPEYAQIMAGYADYLINTKGYTCVKYFNAGNEVNLVPEYYTYANWKTGINNIYNEFSQKGLLSAIKLVGPDAGYTNDLWLNETLADFPTNIGAYDYHYYYDSWGPFTGSLEDNSRLLRNTAAVKYPDKPFYMGESGYQAIQTILIPNAENMKPYNKYKLANAVASAMIGMTRAGIDSNMLWLMDDATYVGWNHKPVGNVITPDVDWKIGGLWNSAADIYGVPEQKNPRPYYYTWATISRYFPKDTKIVYSNNPGKESTNSLAGIYTSTRGTEISVALTNSSVLPAKVMVKCSDVTGLTDLIKYQFSEGFIPKDSTMKPAPVSTLTNVNFTEGFEIELPAMSTVVLSTMDTTKTVTIAPANHNYVRDELASVCNMDSFTSNLGFNSYAATPSVIYPGGVVFDNATFNGDNTRIHRNNSSSAEIVYNVTNVKNFRAAVYQNVAVTNPMTFYVSADKQSWTQISTTAATSAINSSWNYKLIQNTSAISTGYNYVKVVFLNVGNFSDTQLTRFEATNTTLPAVTMTGVNYVKAVSTEDVLVAQSSLPGTVMVIDSMNKFTSMPVTWSGINSQSKSGLYNIRGTINSTGQKINMDYVVTNSITDNMDDGSVFNSTPTNAVYNIKGASIFGGDATQVTRATEGSETALTYMYPGLDSFTADLFIYGLSPDDMFKAYTSTNGTTWTEQTMAYTSYENPDSISWPKYVYNSVGAIPANTVFIKFVIPDIGVSWGAQIARIELHGPLFDTSYPAVTGVVDNTTYTSGEGTRSISFDKGTATLNGSPFTSGSSVTATGNYLLIITLNNHVNVNFSYARFGDVTGDGAVALADLAAIKAHLLKSNLLTGIFATAGDINANSKISISELLAVKKHILGIALIS